MRFGIQRAIGVSLLLVVGAGIGFTLSARAQQEHKIGYQDTPILPGGKWHVHDGTRPQPTIIDPGSASTQEAPGKPPSDAHILFDGTDLSKWIGDNGKPAAWVVSNGFMTITPKTRGIHTVEDIGDCQMHIEWSAPNPPRGRDQDRGNSGVIFFNKYEVQVLDSYENITYPDGQAASIYGSYPPLVNAMRKPGEWNVYDIFFNVPRFKDGKLEKPGYFTVIHNGVIVQNHVELLGDSFHRKMPAYTPHAPKGPLYLQDHGHPVRYRNIWYRELKDSD